MRIEHLLNTAFPNFFFSESKLTNLLRDPLGGNCKTKVIVHQKPRSDPRVTQAVLNAAEYFGRIVNFCVVNDTAAQVKIKPH